jgi:hypothetical protein
VRPFNKHRTHKRKKMKKEFFVWWWRERMRIGSNIILLREENFEFFMFSALKLLGLFSFFPHAF